MRPIIRAEGISKRYLLGRANPGSENLREHLSAWARSPLGHLRRRRESNGILWALKDVGFEVNAGEVVGVIGSNGAGKSTLLKILSRITEPTTGRIELYGRIGSLLEVGTGFHPDLTGRENVILNGAILGVPRAEIKRKFDEIVAFAEIEKFIDTPVKHYSSGMYMRLAFSVPAHLEPEIMLVDEVLAVGDIAFQRKCLERIKRMKQHGMTILLVSHNMAAIQSTCERSLYLHNGKISGIGPSAAVVRQFREALQQTGAAAATNYKPETGQSEVTITGFDMAGADGVSRRKFQFGEEARIRIDLFATSKINAPLINFGVRRGDGVIVCNFNNWFDNFKIDYLEGKCTLEGWLPPLRLIPHWYEIYVIVWQRARFDLGNIRPLASGSFGEFSIEGPPMTDQEGVFQEPALKWIFTKGDESVEYTAMNAESLTTAYSEYGQ